MINKIRMLLASGYLVVDRAECFWMLANEMRFYLKSVGNA